MTTKTHASAAFLLAMFCFASTVSAQSPVCPPGQELILRDRTIARADFTCRAPGTPMFIGGAVLMSVSTITAIVGAVLAMQTTTLGFSGSHTDDAVGATVTLVASAVGFSAGVALLIAGLLRNRAARLTPTVATTRSADGAVIGLRGTF